MIAQRALMSHHKIFPGRGGGKGKGTVAAALSVPFPLAPPMLLEYKNVHFFAVNRILPQNEPKHTQIYITVQKIH